MKKLILAATLALTTTAGPSFAQSESIRVQPGYFCADNKCVRFSNDLSKVSVQARRAVSIADYGLNRNPVVSRDTFREIFRLALIQNGVNGNSR